MILTWQNHIGAFVGAHRYLTVGMFTQLPQYAAISVAVAPRGKGRPTVTFIDRQAVLLRAELQVPEPVASAAGLATLPPSITAPAVPVPWVLAGARAVQPEAPTPILVLNAAAVLAWAEWRVPDRPLELTPDEMLTAMMFWEDK